MATIYIGFFHTELKLFSSGESQTPCGDHFPVAYGATENFKFIVKDSASEVKFDHTKPIQWFDLNLTPIAQPANITPAPLVPCEDDRVLIFQDQNSTKSEVKHRFALQMLVAGNPVTIGPMESLAEQGAPGLQRHSEWVDPTIIDKGDQGTGGDVPDLF